MKIAGRLDQDGTQFFTKKDDLSSIVRFNWKNSAYLKEALKVVLESRLESAFPSKKLVEPSPCQSKVLEAGEYKRLRCIIASNPETPAAVLAYLAKDSDPDVLERVAENPETPLYILERLARCTVPVVRAAVAENPNVSPDILTVLGADAHDDVRYIMSENPNMPEELLVALTEDSNPWVAHRAEQTLLRLTGGCVVKGSFARALKAEAADTVSL